MGPQVIFKSWFKYHLLNLSTRWLHAIASTSGRQWSWWMWLQGDPLITDPWRSRWAHGTMLCNDMTMTTHPHQRLKVRSLISLSVLWDGAGRPQLQLLPFRISARIRRLFSFSFCLIFTGFGIFVWQLCEHVVEQSKEPLELVMMWKSQLCSSSVVMKILPFYTKLTGSLP